MDNPRVFISYAHESAELIAAVRSLADWLTSQGVETITDHPYQDRPPELGWAAWMLHGIEDADVVLVVCTPALKARYEKRKDETIGKGGAFEGAVVTQAIYATAQRNKKFFPVIPDGGRRLDIPAILRDFNNDHKFPTGNAAILRLIRDEVQIPKPVRWLGTLPPGQLRGANDNRLVPREGRVYGRVPEIGRVLEFLCGADEVAIVCAHVTGTAGIGKTEVCKAALRNWLLQFPQAPAFYIEVPDSAGADELIYRIARALGADNVASFDQLQAILVEGLYYLDNLESVVERREGSEVLRRLRRHPGVRVLASSRVSLPGELGRPIEIDSLPLDAAELLFYELWTGTLDFDDKAAVRRFVAEDLGRHALTVTLTARLGQSYAFPTLVQRWRDRGTALAADTLDDSTRYGSLAVSLALTAESLRPTRGSLLLWAFAALFPVGIDEASLAAFELAATITDDARQHLSRHHVWTLSEGRFRLLPPVARYAIEEATREIGGFSWRDAGKLAFGHFTDAARRAKVYASSEDALEARRYLLDNFGAVVTLMGTEASLPSARRELLDELNGGLLKQYQFRAAQSRELLKVVRPRLTHPGEATRVQADLEGRLGRPDEAKRYYAEALDMHRRARYPLGRAHVMKSFGDLELRLGRIDAAKALFGQALRIYKRTGYGPGHAPTLQSLGNLEVQLGRFDRAHLLYSRAIDLFEIERSDLGRANTLKSLGDLEARLDRMAAARPLFDRARALFIKEHDSLGQANAIRSLGDLELRCGNARAAKELFDSALDLYEREQAIHGQANTMQSYGDLEIASERPDAARQCYAKALSLFERAQDPQGQESCRQSLAVLGGVKAALAGAPHETPNNLPSNEQQREPSRPEPPRPGPRPRTEPQVVVIPPRDS